MNSQDDTNIMAFDDMEEEVVEIVEVDNRPINEYVDAAAVNRLKDILKQQDNDEGKDLVKTFHDNVYVQQAVFQICYSMFSNKNSISDQLLVRDISERTSNVISFNNMFYGKIHTVDNSSTEIFDFSNPRRKVALCLYAMSACPVTPWRVTYANKIFDISFKENLDGCKSSMGNYYMGIVNQDWVNDPMIKSNAEPGTLLSGNLMSIQINASIDRYVVEDCFIVYYTLKKKAY